MVKEARKHIEHRNTNEDLRGVIVIGNPLWRPGLAGLVASSLVEAYARPVFVWGRAEDGTIKGSCRSDGTVNLVELMTSVTEGFFADVGGHALAGGFSLLQNGVHTMEDELVLAYQKVRFEKEKAEWTIDAMLSLDAVNWSTWKIVEQFAPFGMGNPKPIFLFEGVRIADVRRFGKERAHLELSFENSRGGRVLAILFFATDPAYSLLAPDDKVELVATFDLNTFRGKRELRLRIVNVAKKG